MRKKIVQILLFLALLGVPAGAMTAEGGGVPTIGPDRATTFCGVDTAG
jgi:hypothetical protein